MEWKQQKGIAALCNWLNIGQSCYRLARVQIGRVYVEPPPICDRKSGKLRHLCYPAPDSELRVVQKLIKDRILSKLELLPQVRGYRPGSHNISTAAEICGHPFMGKVDIRKFHPSITPEHVSWALSEHGLSASWAREIARLATYKGALPQGASTSSHIANIVIDSVLRRDVVAFCARRGVQLLNFGDDIAFYGPRGKSVRLCVTHAKKAFQKYGFVPNEKCRDCEHRGDKRLFVGCATGRNAPDLPREKYRDRRSEVRAAVQSERMHCSPDPLTSAGQLNSYMHQIRYVKRLNPKKARRLLDEFYRLCAARRSKLDDKPKPLVVPA